MIEGGRTLYTGLDGIVDRWMNPVFSWNRNITSVETVKIGKGGLFLNE